MTEPRRPARPARRSGRGPGAPRLRATLDELRPGRAPGSWRAAWRIRNEGDVMCTVLEAWHPHGRFRSRRRALALRIAPGSVGSIEMTVRSDVGANEIVENAFLILQVRSSRRRWRVIARMRLRGRTAAPPEATVEAVDAHPAAR